MQSGGSEATDDGRARRRIPFVVATGYNQSSLPESLANAARVEKPFAPAEVVELLVRMRQNCD